MPASNSAPEAVTAGRIVALLVLAAALLAPIDFVIRRDLAVDEVRMVGGGDAMVILRLHADSFAELRQVQPSAILWALVIPIVLLGMIAESIAYRRAIAGERAAGFTASLIRAGAVAGVAIAAFGSTLRIDHGKLEPGLALGGLAAAFAIIVLVAAAVTEAAACRRGLRGGVLPAVEIPPAQARASG